MRIITILVAVFTSSIAFAGELPRAEPKDVGLNAKALEGIDRKVNELIEKRAFPGAIVAVAREGKVAYFRSFGNFKKDSIVRIYSMSKPITVAAALLLVDEGRLKLDDPVAKYIPAFANLLVHGSEAKPPVMTVQHLMEHTAGFTYGLFSNTPVDRMMRSVNILDRTATLEAAAAKLAKLPLLYAPGTRWNYGVSTDVLGRVIEIVSGKPFDQFLQQHLFAPLGMVDTGFSVPDDKLARFVPNYTAGSIPIEKPESSAFRKQPKMLSGGGGLVSTTSDYMRFALMLANNGMHEDKRILTKASVLAMTTNQLADALIPIRLGPLPQMGTGFGLGVSVRVKEFGKNTRVGTWGWGGAASTMFSVSPQDNTVIVTMLQRMPFWNGLDRAIRPIVYGAIGAPDAVKPKPGIATPQPGVVTPTPTSTTPAVPAK